MSIYQKSFSFNVSNDEELYETVRELIINNINDFDERMKNLRRLYQAYKNKTDYSFKINGIELHGTFKGGNE